MITSPAPADARPPGEPPPSRLRLLHDFLNSTDERSFSRFGRRHQPTDQFASEDGLAAFLRAQGLLGRDDPVRRPDTDRARKLRSTLRDAIRAGSAPAHAEPFALPMVLEWSAAGAPVIAPGAGGVAGALATVALEAAGAVSTGDWARIKMCAAEDCHWIFYDRSKPQTRRWCATEICGNRAKTASYRARHASHAP